MIKKIEVISTGTNKYLYENEVKIILEMINNFIVKKQIGNKIFMVSIRKNKTANVSIYKIQKIWFVNVNYKLLTSLKIKFN